MIGCLGAELDLAQTFMGVFCCFCDGITEKIRIHEMRTGTGGQEAAVPDQAQAALIDLAVATHGSFDGVAGFCESGRIQDDDIVEFPLFVEIRKQVKNIRAQILQACAGPVDQPAGSGGFCLSRSGNFGFLSRSRSAGFLIRSRNGGFLT